MEDTGSSTVQANLDEKLLPAETETDKEAEMNFRQDSEPNTIKSVGGRVRLYSESQVYTISRCEESEPAEGGPTSEEGMGDGTPFRGRSQSAPAALWAAKRYGRQLRRMSDEFDTWLDRGAKKKMYERNVRETGSWADEARGHVGESQRSRREGACLAPYRQGLRGWFSFLWSPKEEEGRE